MRVALLFILPLLLFADTIKSIKYDGLIHISPMIANEMINMRAGETLDIEKVDRAIVEFFKQGYFNDIYATEEDGVLTFHFFEKPVIANVQIDGLGSGRDYQDLKENLPVKKGDIYDKVKMQRVKSDIVKFFEDKGYVDTVVEEKTEEIGERSLQLTLIINRGENITIENIKYCGAKKYGGSDFEAVTANREREFLGWMWGFNDGELKVDQLPMDGFRIKDFYMRKGYLDAEISQPYLEADFNTYTASINYEIKEGDVYSVSSVEIVQDRPLLEVDKVIEELRMEPGRRFNIERVRQDMEFIKTELGNMGYAFARVMPDTKKNEEEKTVAITYQTYAGEKVYINDVLISGNTRTKDRVIRREVYLAPGDLYNATDMRDSEDALKRTGYFDEVEIEERRVSEEKIDLLIRVKEARTGEFRFGAGYGSYGGVSGNVAISDRNVFGSGIQGTASIDMSQKSSLYKLSVYNPRFNDTRYSLGGSVYRSKYQAYDYTQTTSGFDVTVGRQLTRNWHAYATYELSNTELSDITSNTTTTFDKYYHGNKYLKSAIRPGVTYNTTDDYLLPRRGITENTYIEYAGLGGDAQFIKNYNSLEYFLGLRDEIDIDLILRYKGKFGVGSDQGYFPINEKFYLGGISTVRGYKAGSISPLDSSGNRIGGEWMMVNTLELSQSLVNDGKFRLGIFYDYGMIGENSLSEIQRSGTGAMIEWISPLGAIDLIFPVPIDSKPGDKTSDFEFSMGRRF